MNCARTRVNHYAQNPRDMWDLMLSPLARDKFARDLREVLSEPAEPHVEKWSPALRVMAITGAAALAWALVILTGAALS